MEPDVQCSNSAVDNLHRAASLHGGDPLNDTLAQLTKASETQTATLTSLLLPDSDEEADEEDSNTSNTQLNISATLNNALDPSDFGVAKKSACSDLGKQNDVLESLTQAFVQTKDKSPAITEKVVSLIDDMASGGLSPETVRERVDKYPPPENCKFMHVLQQLTKKFGICFQGGARQLTLLFRRYKNWLVRVCHPVDFGGPVGERPSNWQTH